LPSVLPGGWVLKWLTLQRRQQALLFFEKPSFFRGFFHYIQGFF
jgi:hypothetical protein